jgi:hypothetical protein
MERFLAKIDWFIGWDMGAGDENSTHTREFYTYYGPRIAIVEPNGHVRLICGLWSVTHHYDSEGNLISRIPKRKTVKEGERIVYGDAKVQEAYRNQHRYILRPLWGGLEMD